MSAHDTVPTLAEVEQDDLADVEEWLSDAFHEIGVANYERRHGDHDDLGYFAELAGSPGCVARGHASHVDEEHPLFEAWADEHPLSWEGERLCQATKYGTACTACEGDCGNYWEPESVWTLPGVTGERKG